MSNEIQDLDLILSRLGYTPSQIELAKYNATKIIKQIKTEHYQQIKTLLSVMKKPELTALTILLSFENLNLATIVVLGVNKQLNELELDKDNKMEIKE